MLEALLVAAAFLFSAVIAVMLRNKLRKTEALCDPVLRKSEKLLADSGLAASLGFAGKDAGSMDRLFAMMFRRNKSGVISFQPLAVLLFASLFICIFPFNSVFHAKNQTNPKLLQYWEQIGGQDGFNKMSSAQKDEAKEKIESLLSDKT